MDANESAMYFRKGFGLKADVQGTLASDYSGRLVDLLQTRSYELSAGDTTVRLAREFGFCYGVERAVEYAYQTTMLMSESLEIGEMLAAAMRDRYGAERLPEHFRAFDTICSATQERQDAVEALLDSEHVDLMIVVGGYNSSNTCNLARICAARTISPAR